MASIINASTAGVGGVITTADNSGILNIQTAGTTAVTVNASQNVGIGTTIPNVSGQSANVKVLTVQGVSGNWGGVEVSSTSGSFGNLLGFYGFTTTGSSPGYNMPAYIGTWLDDSGTAAKAGGSLRFFTQSDNTAGAAERMRIASNGNLLVGTTSALSSGGVLGVANILNSADDGKWALALQNNATTEGQARGLGIRFNTGFNTGANEFIFCVSNATARFFVNSNGGIANYSANNVNLSDKIEKTNFAPAGNYLDKICAIPVQTFNYIDQDLENDDGLTIGVVAQDVQAIAPELVTERNWGTEEEPKMRLSVYQTDLQYALMKSIQELKAIVDTQAEQIKALQGAKVG